MYEDGSTPGIRRTSTTSLWRNNCSWCACSGPQRRSATHCWFMLQLVAANSASQGYHYRVFQGSNGVAGKSGRRHLATCHGFLLGISHLESRGHRTIWYRSTGADWPSPCSTRSGVRPGARASRASPEASKARTLLFPVEKSSVSVPVSYYQQKGVRAQAMTWEDELSPASLSSKALVPTKRAACALLAVMRCTGRAWKLVSAG